MSIFSKLFASTNVINLHGATDWHSHILPGVDDGIQQLDDSLTILSAYEKMGISNVWFTPHIMEDIPNTTESLRESFNNLAQAYSGNIKLHLAAENMLDSLFDERLQANDVLPIGNEQRILLVETSYFNPPISLSSTLERIKSKGYFPLLAHPERYTYMTSLNDYRKLKEKGVLFQLNLMSLCGRYGSHIRDKALDILSRGWYDYIGSDIHRIEHIEALKNIKLKQSLLEKLAMCQ
jgi:tyrosine-protein phosphatase YwqE